MKRALFVLAVAASLAACRIISPFSQAAYEQAVSLKVDSLDLMDQATDDYAPHAAEAKAIRLRMEKAYEYARGRDHNDLSTRQWEIMKSTGTGLLGDFLADWARKTTMKPAAIEDKKRQVAQGFDQIIGLESGKNKQGGTP